MTEKDELVEVVARAIVQVREQNGGPPWDWYFAERSRKKHVLSVIYDEARAAIASIRPTIVEEVLREVWHRTRGLEKPPHIAWWIEHYAMSEHGLDLTQDGER